MSVVYFDDTKITATTTAGALQQGKKIDIQGEIDKDAFRNENEINFTLLFSIFWKFAIAASLLLPVALHT